ALGPVRSIIAVLPESPGDRSPGLLSASASPSRYRRILSLSAAKPGCADLAATNKNPIDNERCSPDLSYHPSAPKLFHPAARRSSLRDAQELGDVERVLGSGHGSPCRSRFGNSRGACEATATAAHTVSRAYSLSQAYCVTLHSVISS